VPSSARYRTTVSYVEYHTTWALGTTQHSAGLEKHPRQFDVTSCPPHLKPNFHETWAAPLRKPNILYTKTRRQSSRWGRATCLEDYRTRCKQIAQKFLETKPIGPVCPSRNQVPPSKRAVIGLGHISPDYTGGGDQRTGSRGGCENQLGTGPQSTDEGFRSNENQSFSQSHPTDRKMARKSEVHGPATKIPHATVPR
jgi:hypothetical protein